MGYPTPGLLPSSAALDAAQMQEQDRSQRSPSVFPSKADDCPPHRRSVDPLHDVLLPLVQLERIAVNCLSGMRQCSLIQPQISAGEFLPRLAGDAADRLRALEAAGTGYS